METLTQWISKKKKRRRRLKIDSLTVIYWGQWINILRVAERVGSQAKVEFLGRGTAEGTTKDNRQMKTGRADKVNEEDMAGMQHTKN